MVNVVSVFMYKSLGLSDSKIAFFTSLVAIPWMIKPLWGALIEMFRTKKTFVLATELGGGISFGLVALSLHLPFWFAVNAHLLWPLRHQFIRPRHGCRRDLCHRPQR